MPQTDKTTSSQASLYPAMPHWALKRIDKAEFLVLRKGGTNYLVLAGSRQQATDMAETNRQTGGTMLRLSEWVEPVQITPNSSIFRHYWKDGTYYAL